MTTGAGLASPLWRHFTRRAWDRLAIYLPIVLMGAMAMTTYWLVRITPGGGETSLEAAPRHVPDYFMRDFAVRVFDARGQLKSEVHGAEGRHYPDTDTLEIDAPRIRTISAQGRMTTAQATRGIINATGTEIQLFDNARVVREADASHKTAMRHELRSDFLHIFSDTEEVRSHLPVEMIRGTNDRFTADRMEYDNLGRTMTLQGRVRGVIQPKHTKP